MSRCCAWLLVLVASGCVPNGPASSDAGPAAGGGIKSKPQRTPPGPQPGRPPLPPQGAMQAQAQAQAPPSAASAAPLPKDPPLTTSFEDGFDRDKLGDNWRSTSPAWQIEGGRLCGRGARNHPVWLARTLPVNVRFEFNASTQSSDGDLKAEFFGDGASAATGVSYTNATSYLTIFGGWKNSFHVLARIDEHAPNRPQIRVVPDSEDAKERPVVVGQSYHFRVERTDGRTISWWIGDILMFKFTDPEPLAGAGHDHFGFNDWEVPVCFDNVKVVPL